MIFSRATFVPWLFGTDFSWAPNEWYPCFDGRNFAPAPFLKHVPSTQQVHDGTIPRVTEGFQKYVLKSSPDPFRAM